MIIKTDTFISPSLRSTRAKLASCIVSGDDLLLKDGRSLRVLRVKSYDQRIRVTFMGGRAAEFPQNMPVMCE